ncbi:PilW family protein [Alkalihalobacterium sp. APHAB7]|uniref:PilW family protein n=1 Tax=Alkalihalobacterium sp. APHAB7 TaxID=3402081 RepID=UPI003AAF0028
MKNQRGVTLVELLTTIVIMGIITAVIISLLQLSIKSERTVSIDNELQREARLIVEYITTKLRDDNYDLVEEPPDSNNYVLYEFVENDDNQQVLKYENNKVILLPSGNVLSENVISFRKDYLTDGEYINFKLKKGNHEYEVSTKIGFVRIRN